MCSTSSGSRRCQDQRSRGIHVSLCRSPGATTSDRCANSRASSPERWRVPIRASSRRCGRGKRRGVLVDANQNGTRQDHRVGLLGAPSCRRVVSAPWHWTRSSRASTRARVTMDAVLARASATVTSLPGCSKAASRSARRSRRCGSRSYSPRSCGRLSAESSTMSRRRRELPSSTPRRGPSGGSSAERRDGRSPADEPAQEALEPQAGTLNYAMPRWRPSGRHLPEHAVAVRLGRAVRSSRAALPVEGVLPVGGSKRPGVFAFGTAPRHRAPRRRRCLSPRVRPTVTRPRSSSGRSRTPRSGEARTPAAHTSVRAGTRVPSESTASAPSTDASVVGDMDLDAPVLRYLGCRCRASVGSPGGSSSAASTRTHRCRIRGRGIRLSHGLRACRELGDRPRRPHPAPRNTKPRSRFRLQGSILAAAASRERSTRLRRAIASATSLNPRPCSASPGTGNVRVIAPRALRAARSRSRTFPPSARPPLSG